MKELQYLLHELRCDINYCKVGYENDTEIDNANETLLKVQNLVKKLTIPRVVGQSFQLMRDTFIKSREETARAREASAIKQTLEIYCAHDELPTVNEVLERIGRKH